MNATAATDPRVDRLYALLPAIHRMRDAEQGYPLKALLRVIAEQVNVVEDDIAGLYDGFSFLTIVWLEALGFCSKGEGGRFIEGGKRIALDGERPLNTNGGQLSAGRLHGYGFLHEACTQLRSAAGDRQVPGSPEVAVVGVGGGPLGGCVLLTR